MGKSLLARSVKRASGSAAAPKGHLHELPGVPRESALRLPEQLLRSCPHTEAGADDCRPGESNPFLRNGRDRNGTTGRGDPVSAEEADSAVSLQLQIM